LRFPGLDFGRGIDARPDEPGVLLALEHLGFGPPMPSLVLYGGGFFLPLAAFVGGTRAVQGSQWTDQDEAAARFDTLVMVRRWSAVLSAVTVLLTYATAFRLGGLPAGIMAGLLVAVSPLAVRESHSGKADSAAAFAVALLAWGGTHAWRRAGAAAASLGAAAALAVATKAQVAMLPATLWAIWSAMPRSAVFGRAGLVALGTFVGVSGALHWYVLLHPIVTVAMLPPLLASVRETAHLAGGDVVRSPLWYHASLSLPYGYGPAMAILVLPGLLWGLARPPMRVVGIIGLCCLLPPLLSRLVLARFVLPALVPSAVLVGCLTALLVRGPRRGHLPWLVTWVACAVLLIAPPLVQSGSLLQRLGREDTRLQAAAWLARNLPAGSRVVVWGAPPGAADFGGPPLPASARVWPGLSPRHWDSAGIEWIVWHSYPIPWSSEQLPLEAGAFESVAVFSPFDSTGQPSRPVLEPLDAFYLPLARLRGVERPGPRIEVLRRNKPDETAKEPADHAAGVLRSSLAAG
jgi:4-amino-4-deoxy-L-arabinose transferase-like glycosyltransferase